jgi:hypothetical protein
MTRVVEWSSEAGEWNSRLLSGSAGRPPAWTGYNPARVGGHRGFSLQGAISIACRLARLMPPPSLVEAQDYLRRVEEVLQWLLSQL